VQELVTIRYRLGFGLLLSGRRRCRERLLMTKRGGATTTTTGEKEAKPWFVDAFGGKMSDEYVRYMSEEWGFVKRGDRALFEKLCLEGAQAGLSWATILAKREGYRRAFHNFDVEACAKMSKEDIDALVKGDGSVIRHRGKLDSVVGNANAVLALRDERRDEGRDEPEHGFFDDFLWSFVDHRPQLNAWKTMKDMPCETEASIAMSKALKQRGFKFVGSKICYSLMQSCGFVVDHLYDTPEWHAAKARIDGPGSEEPPQNERQDEPPKTEKKKAAGRPPRQKKPRRGDDAK